MVSRRTIFIGVMLLLPVLVYIGFGAYALWQTGLFRWTWWIIPIFWLAAYLVNIFWKRKLLPDGSTQTANHWTPNDETANRIIRKHQEQVETLTAQQLTDIQFYVKSSQELAADLARHYHPNANDPVSALTAVEVLAAIRLAVDDLEDWFQDSVPGSHMVTIKQWRALGEAPKWVKRVSDAGWLASVIWNPLNAAKFVTSRLTLGPITEDLKSEILATVYLQFMRHMGFYLIEMNSGRLRRGALRYRQAFERAEESQKEIDTKIDGQAEASIPKYVPESVVIAVIGQTNAGKSSVINALLGRRETATDAVPSTHSVSRHVIPVPETNETVTLLDTPGYADADAPTVHKKHLKSAISEADIVLLVIDVHQPARTADLEVLRSIQTAAAQNSKYRPPPIILCLTHIDLLSPVMEWDPPYDLSAPQSAKAESIRDAVDSTRELFQDFVVDVVPVCSDEDHDRVYNVDPGLVKAISQSLNVGKSVGLLRAYEEDLDRDRWSALLTQLKNSGLEVVNLLLDEGNQRTR
ncbi:GTPase Era [Thalassoglobus neptunius]|uniref:GTPase Era n=1 Tax=Thalassoglobus neptunius TaxID=1938619 RepID=A0A5C5X6D8_9PLAN|nr:GTPase [Thalassoglobus neptunius]TWT58500.1 GTPase Era [Thalassoglobus neptunius]